MNTKPTFSQMKKTIRTGRASARMDWTTRHSLFLLTLEALFKGDEELMKLTLRDVINGQIGFESLASKTGIPSKSLHRMLSKKGNPTSKNLFHIIRTVAVAEGFQINVNVTTRIRKEGDDLQEFNSN